MNKNILIITFLILYGVNLNAQKKFLFDASKAETAGNADWIIDADHWNLDYIPYATLGGNEANAQRFPTPSQNNITSSAIMKDISRISFVKNLFDTKEFFKTDIDIKNIFL